MSYQSIDFRIENHIAHITFNQGDRGNPIDEQFCAEFKRAAISCNNNPEVRAVLIRAEGRFFSVGGDINSFIKEGDALPDFIQRSASDIHAGVAIFAQMNAPVIVALHSLVTGGSIALAAGADFALAAQNTKFYAAFTGIGFSCDCGTSHYLPRRVGLRKATEFLMRNQTWNAEQALEAGLISSVSEDDKLYEDALALATELAQGPTFAYGKIKNLMLNTFSQPLEQQLHDEASYLRDCSATADAKQAITAVKEKTKPVFSGK